MDERVKFIAGVLEGEKVAGLAREFGISRKTAYKVIEHCTTRVKRPQSNGIVERFHRTLLDEHFRVDGRRTWFETIDEMQVSLDDYLVTHNTSHPHSALGYRPLAPVTIIAIPTPLDGQLAMQ
jgi:transposase InsO family protein